MDNHKTIPMIMFKYRNSALIILLWASMISMQNNFTLSNIWILALQNQNLQSNIKLSPTTRHMIYLTLYMYPWVSMKSILILKHLYYVNVTSDCYLNCLPINIWYCAIIFLQRKHLLIMNMQITNAKFYYINTIILPLSQTFHCPSNIAHTILLVIKN